MCKYFCFSYSKIIDEAIQNVLKHRNEHASGSLTAQDLFYVKVTRMHEIFRCLGNLVNTEGAEKDATRQATLIMDVNSIVLVSTRILCYKVNGREIGLTLDESEATTRVMFLVITLHT